VHGIYIGNNKMLVAPKWGGKLVVPSDDLSITRGLILSGTFELLLTQFFINNVKFGNTVFDIGANIGYFTVLLGY